VEKPRGYRSLPFYQQAELHLQIEFRGIYTDRIGYWKNSDQRQRWVGTALQEIELNLRKVKGYRHPGELREAMKKLNSKNNVSHAA